MACKNCEALRKSLEDAREFHRTSLAVETRRVDMFQRALEAKQARPAVKDLLEVASAAAQIAYLNQKEFPAGSLVTDAASAVALGALKQVRERLEEGAKDA